uniref:Ig-like domain-containing protein n=1 Tax=Sparus aurata TaxID=8175 RepID=A0A671X3A9_SPAAU
MTEVSVECLSSSSSSSPLLSVFISFSLSSPHTPTCSPLSWTVRDKPPVVTLRRGETATMDCNLGTVTDSYAWWYKQIPGGVPQFVLCFHHSWGSIHYGSGFSSPKFTSTHQSESDYRLIINNVEEGDSAVYYCTTWDNSVKERSSLPPPVLTLFPPSSAELQSNKASLVCLSSQSVPFADVSWLAGGSPVSSGISTSTAVQQPDQTFQISSFLAIQTSDWNMEKVYTCKVSLGSQTAEKNINKSDCRTEE